MPYYFTKGRAYNINYSDLKTELLKLLRGTVFNSYIYCDIYIDKWLVWLKTSDDMTFEQMDTNQEYYAKVINKFRIFNQNIELGNQMMKIHFNSELFAEAIKNKKNVSNVISYKQFEGSQPYYTWSPPDDGEKSISKGPILVVPFKGAGGAYLVIDGNHRVFEAIEKKEDIKVIYIDLSDKRIRQALFTSVFDEVLYDFYFEMACLSIYKEANPEISDVLLLEKSFVSGASIDYEM